MRPSIPLSVLLGVWAAACSPIALTPPIRTVPLESVATVREGHVAIRTSGAGHFTGWGTAATGSAGGSYGVASDLELQLDGALGYASEIDIDTRRTISPLALAGHVGLKHAVLPWLAFTGGVGLGVGPWGTFCGADLGAIIAYENPYAVPFFAARMQLSTPLFGVSETWIEEQGMSRITRMASPSSVLWFQPSAGLRFPIRTDRDGDGVRISLGVAVAWTTVVAFDQEHGGGALGGETGLAVEF